MFLDEYVRPEYVRPDKVSEGTIDFNRFGVNENGYRTEQGD
jgi:hypothetical protein